MSITTETPATVAALLDAAADHIEKYGHLQGAYFDITAPLSTAPCCMVGAIRAEARLDASGLYLCHEDQTRVVRDAEHELAALLVGSGAAECATDGVFDPVETIAGWNDKPGRSPREVVEKLRNAAELTR